MSRQHCIEGQVALVTGAARGIGLATAQCLLQRGAIVACADVDTKALEQSVSSLGAGAHSYELDVRDEEAFKRVVEQIESDLGPLGILINNAGIMPILDFMAPENTIDRKMVDINLFGVAIGMRAVLPQMEQRNTGTIVNIASTAGRTGLPRAAMYSATKFAVIGLTEAVRREFDHTQIHVCFVLPTLVDTELIAGTRKPLWPPTVSAMDVAGGVIKAIEERKVDVYVPRVGRLSVILPALMPRRVYERIGRMLGLSNVFIGMDEQKRSSYRERTRSV